MGVVETPGRPETWAVWKKTFWETYVAKRRAEVAYEGEEKRFGGSDILEAAPEKAKEQVRRREHQKTSGPAPLKNQIIDSLEGYLDNIAAAATQTDATGGLLAEFAASLKISVDTVARQ